MRKVAFVLATGLLLLASSRAYAKKPSHLERLKSRYPYGLIGDDYGILNEEDLAVNTCYAEVTPFLAEKNMAYSYWQCFPLNNVKIECASAGDDPLNKKQSRYLGIDAESKDGLQSYLARDAMEAEECKDWIRRWKEKTQGEKYLCLSGSYGAFSGIRDGRKETDWVFDKFKTRKGCESHRSDCFLPRHPDKHCVLPEK